MALKRNRMKNHNKICDLLKQEDEDRGWAVWREKRFVNDSGEVGVPDIVMVKGK